MNFFKTKVAILSLILYIAPIVCGIIFIDTKQRDTINVYDISKSRLVVMETDEYITGVVAAEMPAEFEFEALKAQSVAARTYLIKKGFCDAYDDCNICTDSSHCQAYKSVEELKSIWCDDFKKYYNKISKAVSETKGEILTYNNEPISAVFHSTSSGKTENSEDVWQSALPYLRSTDSIYDTESPKYYSSKTIPLSEFIDNILSSDASVDFSCVIIGDITRTAGGSVDKITIGNRVFDGTEIRKLFDLNSANFEIQQTDDNITFNVFGYGHGVGMSQYGANYMAKKGYNYHDILHKYYQDIEIAAYDEYIFD